MSRDQVFLNGHIFTVNDMNPWAEAMLVREGKLVIAGSNAEALAGAEASAVQVDLGGKTVIPGIHDAHSHLVIAAGRQLGLELQLDDCDTLDALGDQIKRYWATHAERQWVIGGVYNPISFTPDILTREWLDDLIPGVPILLHDFSYHNIMVNSAALAAAGIDRNTAQVPGGIFEKDPNTGELTGIIRESAVARVYYGVPERPFEETIQILSTAIQISNRYGITSIQEAGARRNMLQAAKHLDENGQLSAHLICHIPWGVPLLARCEKAEQERLIADRKQYASRRVFTDAVKVMLDGTSMAPIFSHVPLDPDTDMPITYNLLIEPDELEKKVEEWTSQGLIVKAHCTGYGSTRIGLDIYERANQIRRRPGQMHDIAHAHYVSAKDRSRFAELNIVAEMSPAIWHIPAYQEALGKAYDFRTLHEHGALMTIGTDWALPPTPNLFPALAGLLTHGDESIPLELGVRIMTLNGAIAVGQSEKWGSLEAGKDATFIVLDRDIFAAPPEVIAETEVLQTIIQGDTVYDASWAEDTARV